MASPRTSLSPAARDHALRLNAHELRRFEVRHDDDGLPTKTSSFVFLADTGDDLPLLGAGLTEASSNWSDFGTRSAARQPAALSYTFSKSSIVICAGCEAVGVAAERGLRCSGRLRSGQRQSVAGCRIITHGFGSLWLDSMRGNNEAPFWILLGQRRIPMDRPQPPVVGQGPATIPLLDHLRGGIRHKWIEQQRQQPKGAGGSV